MCYTNTNRINILDGRKILMKKRIILIVLGAIFMITGCRSKPLFTYTELPNQYELWKINSSEYILGKRVDDNLITETNRVKIGVEGVITAFTVYEERYIYLEFESQKEFYVMDTKEEVVFGPLNEEEIDYKLTALGIIERKESTSVLNILK